MNQLLQASVRSATPQDQPLIEEIYWDIYYENRHLDWRNLSDWIDTPTFLVLENKWHKLISALVCPQDPPGVAWIKLFLVRYGYNRQEVWNLLFSKTLERLEEDRPLIASVALSDWYAQLLEQTGFEKIHNLVWLQYSGIPESSPMTEKHSEFLLREMSDQDLPKVQKVDQTAFDLIWQLSIESLNAARQHSNYATVIEWRDKIIAYQMSSRTTTQAHLSRLAVLPEFQGIGLGTWLVNDLICHYHTQHVKVITVNTYDNNTVALSLYQKAGFSLSNETYPVYQYRL